MTKLSYVCGFKILENVLKSLDMFKYVQIYLYRSVFIGYVKICLYMFWIGLDRFRYVRISLDVFRKVDIG